MNHRVRWASTLLGAGVLFALGLGLSGMTRPQKVIGFLDITGQWDPTLAFVMAGAIAVHLPFYRLIVRRSSPLLARAFLVPTRRVIDVPLVVGAAVFGVGWGLGGYCPGPGIVALMSGSSGTALFVVSLLAGMLLYGAASHVYARVRARSEPSPSAATAAAPAGNPADGAAA